MKDGAKYFLQISMMQYVHVSGDDTVKASASAAVLPLESARSIAGAATAGAARKFLSENPSSHGLAASVPSAATRANRHQRHKLHYITADSNGVRLASQLRRICSIMVGKTRIARHQNGFIPVQPACICFALMWKRLHAYRPGLMSTSSLLCEIERLAVGAETCAPPRHPSQVVHVIFEAKLRCGATLVYSSWCGRYIDVAFAFAPLAGRGVYRIQANFSVKFERSLRDLSFIPCVLLLCSQGKGPEKP